MRILSGATLLLALAAAPAAAHPHDQAINAVYGQLIAARAAHDVAGMSAAFPPEAILIDARPGPALGGGAELEARLKPQAARMAKDGATVASAYRVERRSVVGNVAIDAGFMRMTMTRPDGQTNARHARFMVTWLRQPSGVWSILGDAAMPAEEAAWAGVPRVAGLRYDD